MHSTQIDKMPGLIPIDAVKNLGWHKVFFNKVTEGGGDSNCIIESDDGVRYACNHFGTGFEIRYQLPATATIVKE